ncbi:MAG: SIR2 family protein [Candidatus Izemoplasmatales bacterium]|nr:SIR2 family protein [Candidatus Izemoplasmatales bacterium]
MSKKYYFKSSNLSLYKDGDKYFKNDDELKAEVESEEYTEIKFDKEIKIAVSSWVNNRFDNIICLIGAGASVVQGEDGKPDKNYGQTVQMIAENVFHELKNEKYVLNGEECNVLTLKTLVEKVQYIKNSVTDNEITDIFNLEDFLSYLLAFEKFVLDDEKVIFFNSKEAIFQEIKRATSYEYTSDKFYHAKFLNILSKLVKKEQKLNIVTTNYDTLIEDSANEEGFTVLDGFKFAQKPIFDASMFDWHLIKDVPNVKTQEVEYMSKVINLLKIHGSLTWELSPTGKNILRKSKDNVTNPVMVFPSSDKYAQSYQEPYFELFTKFQELLKRSNTLLITSGFSFADNHISRMILQAIKSNVSLHILASDNQINPDKPNKNWSDLIKMQENDYQVALLQATMNGKLTDFLGADNEHR